MDVSDALSVIAAAMPDEARQAQIQERRLNLAASATALVLDLGVAGLPEEQRQATEEQVVRIAEEIGRLEQASGVPFVEQPQTSSLADRLSAVEEVLSIVAGEMVGENNA